MLKYLDDLQCLECREYGFERTSEVDFINDYHEELSFSGRCLNCGAVYEFSYSMDSPMLIRPGDLGE